VTQLAAWLREIAAELWSANDSGVPLEAVWFLPGQVLEFRDAGVKVIVRVVDDGDRLIAILVDGLEHEIERALRELAISIIEVLVHWSGIDRFVVRYGFLNLAVVGVEQNLDVR
jgi:hypothetical protein